MSLIFHGRHVEGVLRHRASGRENSPRCRRHPCAQPLGRLPQDGRDTSPRAKRLAPPEVPEADPRPRVWTARPWRPRDPGLSGRPKLRGKPNLRPTRNSLTPCSSLCAIPRTSLAAGAQWRVRARNTLPLSPHSASAISGRFRRPCDCLAYPFPCCFHCFASPMQRQASSNWPASRSKAASISPPSCTGARMISTLKEKSE